MIHLLIVSLALALIFLLGVIVGHGQKGGDQ